MNLKSCFILLLCLLNAAQSNPLKMRKPSLNSLHHHAVNDNIPDKIFAAQIHYSRIPYQYWEHRLQMVKAMGFNALSIYIMWNHHEVEKGKFDYENGNKNLKGFLALTKKYGFKVLFRPGPYVCAQWDFGGLPARLLSNKDLQIRANNKLFLDEVKIYFASLVDMINELSYRNQGNILMLQIQNEYGWYGTDKSYMQALRQIWADLKVNVPEYYVDWFQNIHKCHWQGANIGINNGIKEIQWTMTRQMEAVGYLLGGEIYSGWLTHWGQKWQGKTVQEYRKQFDFLMSNNHSFSMYMAHGGSNFGLTAGANGFQNHAFDYGAHVTSYDYDAPINEQGSPNQKYHIFREMAKKHATWQIPQIPQSIKMISIPNFVPSGFADLLQNLPKPTLTSVKQLINFQDQRLKMWNQGFVVYQTSLNPGHYEINLVVHDFALVYLNGQFITTLDRGERTSHILKLDSTQPTNKLLIVVQSMGHINFAKDMLTDTKGLISFDVKYIPNKRQSAKKHEFIAMEADEFQWNIYTIPIDEKILSWTKRSDKSQFPRLFRYNLTLTQTGDTYLNMQNWQKGYLFVNGYNLGRYWNKGPQLKVFLPGVWLKKGVNDIVVLQLLTSSAKFIKGDTNLMTGEEQIYYKKGKSQIIHLPNPIKTG